MRPAGDKAWGGAIDKLLTYAVAFSIPMPDMDAAISIYREALADLPGDLLAEAVASVCRNNTWGNRMPMPGEIRAHIEADIVGRSEIRAKIKIAIARQARDKADKSAAKQQARVDQFWTEAAARQGVTIEEAKRRANALVEARKIPSENGPVLDHKEAVKNAVAHLTQNIKNAAQAESENAPESAENA